MVALLAGCHGAVFIGNGDSAGAGVPDEPHPDCAAADGVRLCGGNKHCKQLNPPDCQGTGCSAALDINSFSPSGTGVCWADVPGAASDQCIACADGEVCAQRYGDQLVCVSEAVCAALWDLGATDVCRYADKAHYDRRPLPAPSGCPTTPPHGVSPPCGGHCPPCPDFGQCFGRSPDHPFGICAHLDVQGRFDSQPCAFTPDGVALLPPCPEGSVQSGQVDDACMVYAVGAADVAAARRYGYCVDKQECLILAADLPGGVHCLDDNGMQLDP